jgi:hypothetical protein
MVLTLASPAPEQAAQLAEAPEGDQVRRIDVAQLVEETLPAPLPYEETPREDRFESRASGAGEAGSDCSD